MAEYGGLIEYLLSYRNPGGGKLVRFGANVTQIPQFPPNFSITMEVLPRFSAYANIQYLGGFSPQMVPNAFWFETRHEGIIIQVGFITRLGHGLHNMWIEFTQAEPIMTAITNTTPLLQYFEAANEYLVIDSEEDFMEVKRLMHEWGSSKGVETELARTNQLLSAIARGEPAPYPPITERR